MRFIKLHGIKLIIPLALIAGFVAGSISYGVIPATASATPDQSIQNIKSSPKFPINKNGETYGSNSEVTVLRRFTFSETALILISHNLQGRFTAIRTFFSLDITCAICC